MPNKELVEAAIVLIADEWARTRTRTLDKHLPNNEVLVAIEVDRYLRRVGLPPQGGVPPSTAHAALKALQCFDVKEGLGVKWLILKTNREEKLLASFCVLHRHKKERAAKPS